MRNKAYVYYISILFISIAFVAILMSAISKYNMMGGDWANHITRYLGILPYLLGLGLAFMWLIRRR